MIFFYVDEAGDPYVHHVPLLQGETPLFCLTAVAIDSSRWREFERGLLTLKRTYFMPEMTAFAARNPDKRPEHYEIKGRDLFKPSNARSRRNRVFVTKVFGLAQTLDARLFSVVWVKHSVNPVDPMSMYTHGLQILAERFHYHCLANRAGGAIIADSRTHGLNFPVAAGHLSFLFGNPVGQLYTSLIEAPMFVDSTLSAGVQLADILGSAIFGYYYFQECSKVPGLFDDPHPVTPGQFTAGSTGSAWTTKTPARNYSHCVVWWPRLDTLQFKRSDVEPPRPGGQPVPGFYGYRVLRVS